MKIYLTLTFLVHTFGSSSNLANPVPDLISPLVLVTNDNGSCHGSFEPKSTSQIITAGHCIFNEFGGHLTNIFVTVFTAEGKVYKKISNFKTTPSSDFNYDQNGNDIAFLILNEPLIEVKFHSFLSSKDKDQLKGIKGVVPYYNDQLEIQTVSVDMENPMICSRLFNGTVKINSATQICALDKSGLIYSGFSGAPLICGGDDAICGVLSFGPGLLNDSPRPIVFTKVLQFSNLLVYKSSKSQGQGRVAKKIVLKILHSVKSLSFVLIAIFFLISAILFRSLFRKWENKGK